MSLSVTRGQPSEVLPILARLYGSPRETLAGLAERFTCVWFVDSGGEPLGALGLRASPTHGAEVVGGAFPGNGQSEAARALLRSAVAAQPQLYAYAEAHLLPAEALEAVGLRRVSAYTRMAGPLPTLLPDIPGGLRVVPLSSVQEAGDLLLAQRTFSDRIGHTFVPGEAAQPNFAGTDDALGRLAYDSSGRPAGLCRAVREGENVFLGTPGVRPDLRGTGLRRALLLSVCRAALGAGAVRVELEAWGDTEAEWAEDEALGLTTEVLTPIYSSVPLPA